MRPFKAVQLGDVLRISAERLEPRASGDRAFNYIGLENIESHTGRLNARSSTLGSEIQSTKNVFHAGQILYGKLRPYLNKVHLAEVDGICSTDIFVLTCDKSRLVPAFGAYYLRSPFTLHAVQNLMVGANLPRVDSKSFLGLTLPLPPLSEQERIVRILDETEALRCLRADADKRTGDVSAALFDRMFGVPRGKVLSRVSLADLSEIVSGVTKGRNFNGRITIEVPYLRVANVQAGRIDLTEVKTIEALPEEVEQLALRKGDVLLTEGGDFDKLGRGAMWEHDIPNCIHQNHVFRVRVDHSQLDPVFFAKFLLTEEARTYFLGCAKRTTNLASINITQLRGLPVPIPPLSEQHSFAARVAEIRELEAAQAACCRRLDDLFHSSLYRAFQGEL
ncbi:MAG: restriction endonuclease subunit S [Dehalococcoidia bacterium]|nr:restriction endonuclease subunit S [Dehalococcoidia bacterium]